MTNEEFENKYYPDFGGFCDIFIDFRKSLKKKNEDYEVIVELINHSYNFVSKSFKISVINKRSEKKIQSFKVSDMFSNCAIKVVHEVRLPEVGWFSSSAYEKYKELSINNLSVFADLLIDYNRCTTVSFSFTEIDENCYKSSDSITSGSKYDSYVDVFRSSNDDHNIKRILITKL